MPEGTLRLLASSIGLDLGHWPSTLQGAQFRILVGALRRAVILQVTSPRAAICRQRSISVANLFQGYPGSLRWYCGLTAGDGLLLLASFHVMVISTVTASLLL